MNDQDDQDGISYRTGPSRENRLMLLCLSAVVAVVGVISGAWAFLLIPAAAGLLGVGLLAKEDSYLFAPNERVLTHRRSNMTKSATETYKFDQIESVFITRDDVRPSNKTPGCVAYALAVRIDFLTTFYLARQNPDEEKLKRLKERIETLIEQSKAQNPEQSEIDDSGHESIQLNRKQLEQ